MDPNKKKKFTTKVINRHFCHRRTRLQPAQKPHERNKPSFQKPVYLRAYCPGI